MASHEVTPNEELRMQNAELASSGRSKGFLHALTLGRNDSLCALCNVMNK